MLCNCGNTIEPCYENDGVCEDCFAARQRSCNNPNVKLERRDQKGVRRIKKKIKDKRTQR
jgi:NMD protein affecting ribosome stability and mRNA decay